MLLSLPTLHPVGGGPLTQLWEVHSNGYFQGAGKVLRKAVSINSPALAWAWARGAASPGSGCLKGESFTPNQVLSC